MKYIIVANHGDCDYTTRISLTSNDGFSPPDHAELTDKGSDQMWYLGKAITELPIDSLYACSSKAKQCLDSIEILRKSFKWHERNSRKKLYLTDDIEKVNVLTERLWGSSYGTAYSEWDKLLWGRFSGKKKADNLLIMTHDAAFKGFFGYMRYKRFRKRESTNYDYPPRKAACFDLEYKFNFWIP